jgi:hypothetical protein
MGTISPMMSRKFIAIIPLLLVGGIIAQAVILVAMVVLYVPALVFPGLLDGVYQTITKAMAHMFAKSLFGGRRKTEAGMVTVENRGNAIGVTED